LHALPCARPSGKSHRNICPLPVPRGFFWTWVLWTSVSGNRDFRGWVLGRWASSTQYCNKLRYVPLGMLGEETPCQSARVCQRQGKKLEADLSQKTQRKRQEGPEGAGTSQGVLSYLRCLVLCQAKLVSSPKLRAISVCRARRDAPCCGHYAAADAPPLGGGEQVCHAIRIAVIHSRAQV
jgi:hypothetical protein